MPEYDTLRLVWVYLRGIAGLCGQAALGALGLTWALQFVAALFGENHDWGAVLVHLFLSLLFLALFPGQTVWTYRIADRFGQVHTIVGRPFQQDEARD